jgi:hypothetical protein
MKYVDVDQMADEVIKELFPSMAEEPAPEDLAAVGIVPPPPPPYSPPTEDDCPF